jgi:hypothetical protein
VDKEISEWRAEMKKKLQSKLETSSDPTAFIISKTQRMPVLWSSVLDLAASLIVINNPGVQVV